jgi:hypothetical protein
LIDHNLALRFFQHQDVVCVLFALLSNFQIWRAFLPCFWGLIFLRFLCLSLGWVFPRSNKLDFVLLLVIQWIFIQTRWNFLSILRFFSPKKSQNSPIPIEKIPQVSNFPSGANLLAVASNNRYISQKVDLIILSLIELKQDCLTLHVLLLPIAEYKFLPQNSGSYLLKNIKV